MPLIEPYYLIGAKLPVAPLLQPVVLVPGNNAAPATYRAASPAFASAGAGATDIFTITGSATKVVRVTRLSLSCSSGTPTTISVLIIKRSTANSGGTSAAVTAVPVDALDPAATATVLQYTVNPAALGTTVGNIDSNRFQVGATGSPPTGLPTNLDFGRLTRCPVLRGTTDVLAVNIASAAISGASWNISVEWTEEPIPNA